MSIHYYLAYSKNLQEAKEKRVVIQEYIKPFRQYLQTSIQSLKKRTVKAKWEKVEANNPLEKYSFYKWQPLYEIMIKESYFFIEINNPQSADFNQNLIITLNNGEKVRKEIDKSLLVDLEGLQDLEIKNCSFDGENVKLIPLRDYLDNNTIELYSNNTPIETHKYNNTHCTTQAPVSTQYTLKINALSIPCTLQEIPILKNTFKQENLTILYTENDTMSTPLNLTQIPLEDIDTKALPKELRNKIEKNGCVIKLLPLEEEIAEDDTDTPLKYFLDEEVEIYETEQKQRKYSLKIKDKEEFLVELREKGRPTYPTENSILQTKPNTYQLEMQEKAIKTLMDSPINTQYRFIDLFCERKSIQWQQNNTKNNNRLSKRDLKWEVLIDSKRQGGRETKRVC